MSTTNWGAVDRDPNAAARYLDAVSAAIGPIKARSIELLGLKPGAQVLEAGCGLAYHESPKSVCGSGSAMKIENGGSLHGTFETG